MVNYYYCEEHGIVSIRTDHYEVVRCPICGREICTEAVSHAWFDFLSDEKLQEQIAIWEEQIQANNEVKLINYYGKEPREYPYAFVRPCGIDSNKRPHSLRRLSALTSLGNALEFGIYPNIKGWVKPEDYAESNLIRDLKVQALRLGANAIMDVDFTIDTVYGKGIITLERMMTATCMAVILDEVQTPAS